MEIRQCMNKDLVTVNSSSTLQEAAKKMKEKNVGSILVADAGNQLSGILTDRDIALAITTEGKNAQTPVSEVMKKNPKSIDMGQSLDQAFDIMSQHNIRRLPVVENGKLVGVISSSDLAATLKKQVEQFISLEEHYSLSRAGK
ncbi:MAG: CBS domain-containing protein [Nitrospiraceae bacterium]|nr:CBS domain-containing protein [Nitrospiraceae bacterium]